MARPRIIGLAMRLAIPAVYPFGLWSFCWVAGSFFFARQHISLYNIVQGRLRDSRTRIVPPPVADLGSCLESLISYFTTCVIYRQGPCTNPSLTYSNCIPRENMYSQGRETKYSDAELSHSIDIIAVSKHPKSIILPKLPRSTPASPQLVQSPDRDRGYDSSHPLSVQHPKPVHADMLYKND
jgi:hypothetical protein